MKWFLSLLLAAVLCVPLTGCMASPTIDAWADRGMVGVDNAHQNVDEFVKASRKVLADRRGSDIDAVFEDIANAAAGNIEGVEVNAKWLAETKVGLLLLLKLHEQDSSALDNAAKTAHGNLDHITQTFVQIKRLRRAGGQIEEVQVQIDRLSGLVLQLIQAQRDKE